MRISDWSSDVCSSDLLARSSVRLLQRRCRAGLVFPVRGERRIEVAIEIARDIVRGVEQLRRRMGGGENGKRRDRGKAVEPAFHGMFRKSFYECSDEAQFADADAEFLRRQGPGGRHTIAIEPARVAAPPATASHAVSMVAG